MIDEKWIWFYYDSGFSIIPVQKNGKQPNVPRWADYIYSRADKETIQHWIDCKLFENIGVICGAVSNNLVVFDIDDASIVDDIGLNLNNLSEKGAWIVQTGRGYHIYCKSNRNPGATQKNSDLKIEHRANGGYVVAPPSIHSNSKQYSFMNIDKPSDLKPLVACNTELMWSQLLNQVSKLKGITLNLADLPAPLEHVDADCVANMLKGTEKGRRNDTAYALTQYYYHVKHMSPTETNTLVHGWNNDNKPSLGKRELDTVIKSALRSNSKSGCTKIRGLGYCPYKTSRQCRFINPDVKIKSYAEPPKSREELYDRIRKWLYLSGTERIDLILATALTTFCGDKPLWIFLTGASGDAKSELLMSLETLDYVRVIDQMTQNTLASGYKEKGKKVPDIGQELENKHTLIIFPDLACLTSLDSNEKKKIWGQFRNLYDGKITKDTGSGVKIYYRNCHVTILACSTSAIRDEYHINQQLGTRELLYGTEARPEDDIKKMRKALMHRGKEKQMKQELSETMQSFLESHEYNDDIEIPEETLLFMMNESIKLAQLRATVGSSDWATGEISADAENEVPTRLIQQLSLLYRGLYSLDKNYPDDKYRSIVENIVRSSSNPIRYILYNIFLKRKNDWINLKELKEMTRIGRKALLNQLMTMWNLRLLDRKIETETVGGYIYTTSDGYETTRGGRIEEVDYYKATKKILPKKEIDQKLFI